MEGIMDMHHHVFLFLTIVFVFVCWMLYSMLLNFYMKLPMPYIALKKNSPYLNRLMNISKLKLTHNTLIEIIWTMIPSIMLYLMAMPSFLLLYSMDEMMDPAFTIKVIGHQWYWSYEYSDDSIYGFSINFDSYMLPEDELEFGQLSLLEVDNPIVLPINTHMSVIVTATDVLHCWAVPSLGVKMDAVPGSLNQSSIFLKSFGVFYGQCSEICGVNHGFMPIVVKSVSLLKYFYWMDKNL